MLTGMYSHNMDSKGRLFMPAKLREDLGEDFMVTRGLGKCLFVFSMEEFQKLVDKIKEIPISNILAQRFARGFSSYAIEGIPDKQGRITLPQHLRDHINIIKEAVIIGVLNRVEIWSKEGYTQYMENSDVEYDEMLAQMAEFGI